MKRDSQAVAVAVRAASETKGGIAALARAIGVTPGAVHQWISGLRRVPVERCIAIERVTRGAVSCETLRPDVDWAVVRGGASCSSMESAA